MSTNFLGISVYSKDSQIYKMEKNNLCCVLMKGKWQVASKLVLKYPELFGVSALIRPKGTNKNQILIYD